MNICKFSRLPAHFNRIVLSGNITTLQKTFSRTGIPVQKRRGHILCSGSLQKQHQHQQFPHKFYCTNSLKKETKQELGALEGRLFLSYKCKVCDVTNQETFSKLAYNKGVVIVTCKGCKNNHLIADHLGWFKDIKGKTIEEILANKGETVRKVVLDGGMELIPKTE